MFLPTHLDSNSFAFEWMCSTEFELCSIRKLIHLVFCFFFIASADYRQTPEFRVDFFSLVKKNK